MDTAPSQAQVLLVEDNPGDVALVQEGLRGSRRRVVLEVAPDGEAALKLLRSDGAVPPDLILLDINLPRKNGHEVLAELKQDPAFRAIPIVMLTTSVRSADIRQAYVQHANAYVAKAMGGAEFFARIESIVGFWLETAVLPPR